MKERKPRIWKVENGELIEIDPAQLEASEIPYYLLEEEIFRMQQALLSDEK